MRRPYQGWRRWMSLMPVREFKCPHCFEVFLKPPEAIGRLPLIGAFFRRSRLKTSRRLPVRGRSSSGTMPRNRRVAKSLSGFGRTVTRAERAVVGSLLRVIQLLNPARWTFGSSRRSRGDASRTRQRDRSND